MNSSTLRGQVQTILFWQRAIEEEIAADHPSLNNIARFNAKARAALDQMVLGLITEIRLDDPAIQSLPGPHDYIR